MNNTELESMLRRHAEAARNFVALPFDIESEELNMSYKKSTLARTMLLIAAIICVFGTTAFAAYRYLSAKQIADEFGDHALAEYFEMAGAVSETDADGNYKATLLGAVSGEKLSALKTEVTESIYPDRTYAVVAVERTDGRAMTYDDNICVTPLIQGYKPWELNIVTMRGNYTESIINGVLYRLIECDNIEYFADKKVYMAVTDSTFISNAQFTYNESTGEIAEKEGDGTSILFELKLDKSKADPKKAEEYLSSLGCRADEDIELSENETEDGEYELEKPVLLPVDDDR